MKYTLDMTDVKTGESKLIKFDLDWNDGSKFWWSEGNFACDCNRAGVFSADLHNYENCNIGKNRFIVHKAILENGDEIIIDGAKP